MGIDKGEEYQCSGINQIFNNITEKKFPQNKERYTQHRYKKQTEHQIKKTRKETPHIIQQLKH